MRDILNQPIEKAEMADFDADSALALAKNPAELFKMENLIRLESFLAKNAFSLSSEVTAQLTESLANEDVGFASVQMENFGEIRSRLENISTYLDSVSVAARLGSRLGAKVLQAEISTAMEKNNFQNLAVIQQAWGALGLPSIFGRSLLLYIMNQPPADKLHLLERSEIIGLISKDEPAVGRMAATLYMTLKTSEEASTEVLTSIPGQAQAA